MNTRQNTFPNTVIVVVLTKRGGDIVSADFATQPLADRFKPAFSAA